MDSNLGKRKAPTELVSDGRGGFDYKEVEKEDMGKESSASEIAARKILKIRRGGKMLDEETCKAAENNANVNQAKCTIGQALPTYNSQKTEVNPEASFVTKGNNSPQKGGSIFSSNNNTNGTSSFFNNGNNNGQSSFFNNNNEKKEDDKNKASIFNYDANKSNMSSMFNNNNNQSSPKKSPTKVSIFSNNAEPKKPDTGLHLFDKEPQTNIFSNMNNSKPAEQKSGEEPTGNLFRNLTAPTSSLFGSSNTSSNLFANTGGSIFGTLKNDSPLKKKSPIKEDPPKEGGLFANLRTNTAPQSTGLFSGLLNLDNSNKTGGTNIFSGNITSTFNSNQDKNKDEDEGEDDGEEENDENEKEEVIDKTKSTGTYKYEELTEELSGYEVNNFKVNDLQPYGKGKVTVERIKENNNHLLIFRNPAKLILFQGLLVKGLTSSGFMKGKEDAIFIISYVMEKEEGAEKSKPVRKNCKMSFGTNDDAKNLTTYVSDNFTK